MKYNAFLSYSHAADDALAPSLQSALHRFARPWNRLRALRVFRDKTSLAASPELWPAIVDALGESGHFLLLASPASAASRWVQREIDWWLQHRPPQQLLILLTEGELHWDEAAGDFDWQRTTALPASLRGHFAAEPLWVDLRWARSGAALTLRHTAFRLAVLDIAAPLHGRSKDELDGDDVRQFARTRRLAGGAITALVVLTIASVGAAIFAVRQRDEAVRQGTTALAGRLAAQADLLRERGGPADESALLATEALQRLQSIDERSMEVDLSVRRALALLPQRLGGFALRDGQTLEISPDGGHVTLRALADQVSARALPGGALQGCDWQVMADARAAQGLSTAFLIGASTANGSHCATVELAAAGRAGPQPACQGAGPAAAPGQPAPGGLPSITLWQAKPTLCIARVPHAIGGHLRLLLSDDAAWLAITDRAQTGLAEASAFRLWSRAMAADVLRQQGAEALAFGPDGRTLLASHGLWRLPVAGEAAAVRLLAWPRPPFAHAYSRDGRRLATRVDYAGEVTVWSLDTHQAAPTTTPPAGKLLAVSDDGRFLALQGAGGTRLWDIQQGAERVRLPFEGLAAAFGERGLTLLATDPDIPQTGRALVLGLQPAGAALASVDGAPGEAVRWMGFGGQRLLRLVSTGTTLRVDAWSWSVGQPLPLLQVPAPEAAPWALSADGSHLAIGGADSVRLQALDGAAAAMKTLAMTAAPRWLALSPHAERLAAATSEGLWVWALAGGPAWRSAPLADELLALRWSDDGQALLAVAVVAGSAVSRQGPGYRLLRWRPAEGDRPTKLDLGRLLRPPDLACLVDGEGRLRLAGALAPGSAATAAAPAPLRIDAPADACANFSGGALRADIDGTALLVSDPQRGQALARLEHPGDVLRAALSADGRHAATLDDGGSWRVWALDSAELIAQVCARAPRPLGAEAWRRYLSAVNGNDACGRDRLADAAPR